MKTYPLLQSQLGVFMECMRHPESRQYNLPSIVRLDEQVDLDRLADAVLTLFDSRRELRLSFLLDERGNALQYVNPDLRMNVLRKKMSERECLEYAHNGFTRPFDILGRECLFRCEIIETEAAPYLLTDIHHLISDGMTFTPIITTMDLPAAYAGDPLRDIPYGMLEAAEDEQTQIGSEIYEADKQYYSDKFQGIDFATLSTVSRDIPGRMIRESSFLPVSKVDEWCRANGVACNLLFQAAFSYVLSVFLRQDTVAYTSVNHGRIDRRLRTSYGMFVKTVPILSRIEKGMSVKDFIMSFRMELMSTIRHGSYPFNHLCQDLGMTPGISFNFQAIPDMKEYLQIGDRQYTAVQPERGEVSDDMSAMIFYTGDNYEIRMESCEVYNSHDILRTVADAVKSCIENIMQTSPETPITDIGVVGKEEESRLLSLSRGNEMTYDAGQTFPGIFIRQATGNPEHPAVVDEAGSYSYGELNRLSGALAAKLREFGTGGCEEESPFVSIMLGCQKEFLVAAIGVERAGGAYVPLDCDYPADRLLYMLEDSGSQVLITSHTAYDEKTAGGDNFTAKNVLFIEDFIAGTTEGECPEINYATPDGLAYMIYTSGSTGQPKGVMIQHRAKANFVNFIAKEWGHTDKSRICCHSSFSFDASIEDLYPVLTVGGTLYIVPQEARKDLEMLHGFIVNNRITGGCYTTQLGQMLLQTYPSLPVDYLVVGGEKMTVAPYCKCRLINTYGPTEFTVDATFFDVEPGREYRNIPIGRPLHNLSCYVMDGYGHLLPRGIAGELCISGPQVALGYWKREELTAEKFVDCPYDEGKMYHTGDLVRYNEDGDIEYLGRIDNQVKLRGFRIELGEIETRISGYEGIGMCSVQVREVGGVQHLCAYYSADREIDESALKEYLCSRLTEYMVPTAYMQLDEMPLTPNGKINTKALPQPQVKVEEMVAPETETEKKLFELAAEVLRHNQFGVTSNLISMGLTSLSAMRLGVMIQQETGFSVPISAIFADPTLRSLARMIDDGPGRDSGTVGRELLDRYPISENQRGVYIDWEMNRDAVQYNMPKVLKFKQMDAGKLEEAIVRTVNAHPYIKTIFVQAEEDVMQLQRNTDKVAVSVESLESEPDIRFFQQRVKSFNLFEGRLYRFEIYRTPSCVYLFQDIHHSVFDGISDVIFQEDLTRALKGEALSEESYTAFDYAVEESGLLAGGNCAKAESYFDALVAQRESTVYPHSSDGTEGEGFGKFEFEVESERIDSFCRKAGVTPNAYFATVLGQILHRVTREDSVLFSTIDNGRTDAGRMQSVGMYVKTLPVCSTLNPGEVRSTSFEKAVKAMHSQLMETISLSYYPFTRISERHHIRPEILYVYHGKLATELSVDENVEETMLELDTVKVPLTVTVYHKGGNAYTVLLSYNTAMYSDSDMKRLGSAFRAASVNSLTAGSIEEFSMLDEAERRRVEEFRCTCRQEIPWKLFYQPIEENAVRYADRTALVARDRTLTFAEFNVEVNRVAHALLRKGVKRGDRVVLLLPRRSGVIVSMFAVSKTGAAYIPCDPEYPSDRINLIMTDSQAQYVITTPDKAADYPSEKVILLDDIYNNGKAEAGDEKNPDIQVSPEDLAYLIYTSGSTGRPKGVMLRHVGIANYLYPHPSNVHIQGLLDLGVKSFVTITTLSFDMSLKEFAGSLFNGITSILADEQEVMDARLLADLMKRTGAEAINGTCSRILTYLELNEFRDALKNCKAVWSGGEKYPMQLLTTLQELGVHIFNTYGPTEITVSSNIADLTKASKVTVGRPLLNYEEFIVDQFDRELPVGFTGEVLIGGPGVALGYNNLPEMTAERFVEYKGIRVYRSGDLARWEENGEVEILGRNDGQVKLRGFRVELGEIEGVALKYPGIRQTVADIKEVGSVQHLCLYYTSDKDIDEKALEAFLSESLTEYMVPSVYMHIDAVPLTPNGKTNRKALPVPTIRLEEIVLPANDREALLLEVMKEHLHVDELGVTTNLVSMGLSSIGAMRLSARLFQHHNLRVSVKDIIEHPTVREMAELAGTEETVLYKPYEKRRTYPLSEAQRGMLVDCLVNTDALQYNIACALKYKDIDVNRLKKAIVDVCEAHPYIKARIKAEEGDYVQLRNDEEPVEIEERKLDFEPDRAFLQSQVQPFDVLNEKLYRFRLFIAPSYTYLFIDIHHLISDGSSNYILAREMEKAYNGQPLSREEYTAFDRAIDEDNIMKSERGVEAEQYFDRLINGTEATVYTHSTDLDGDTEYGETAVTIPSEAILAFCKENAIAPSSFFLTVFHHVLQRVTRDENTLVYFISNGRSEVQLENFFGVFVKTMPTVVGSFNGNIVESVRAMHRQMLDTIAHDYYPFTKMTERYGLKAEILYNYFVDLQTSVNLGSGAVESIGLDWDTAKTPLSVTITRDGAGNFVSSLEYDARLYNGYDMRLLNRAYCAFAENCVKCAGPLSQVSLVSDSDLPALLSLSRGEKMLYDQKKTFPSVFAEQAMLHPDNIAVVSEEASYTYAQLESRSNALARYLIDNGVKTGGFVCISMPGCADFVTAAIGIEKAGAAYVPVDPEYPEDRKQYMREDCEAGIVITPELLGEVDWSRNESINLAVPDGIAYMIYTSGSTGKPKGVMIPHRAKTHFVNFIAKEWHHTEKSRICCHSSVSFDASIEDLYPVLTVGGTLYIVPQAARKDMEMLHDFIVANGITGGCYTTQLGQMLLQQYPDLPVDYLVVGGEKMSVAPKCGCRLINTYGPTEFTVDATYFDVEPGREYKNIPIGRALHNQAAYVVDSQNQLAPQGIAGELCMAGVQISAGYWRREDLTAEKFTGCGFADGKIYHTGDLVKYNKDGQLEYLGRIDSQVKLRGFRIELGEIETLIAGFKGVRAVSVQVREVGGVQHLCAYYSADGDIDKDVLKTFLAAQLTEYMVPTVYMQLDEMPLTPNGKINTKALPMPEIQAEKIVPPETETEKKLFDIAVELLKHNQFGVTSNLISMGLTSISAMYLSAVLQQKIEVVVPVADIIANPSIRQMAEYIDSGKAKSTRKADIFVKRNEAPAGSTSDRQGTAKPNPFAPKKTNPFKTK